MRPSYNEKPQLASCRQKVLSLPGRSDLPRRARPILLGQRRGGTHRHQPPWHDPSCYDPSCYDPSCDVPSRDVPSWSDRGASALELLLALSLTAVAICTSVPSLGALKDRLALRTAADGIVSLIERQRSLAELTGRSARIAFDLRANSVTALRERSADAGEGAAAERAPAPPPAQLVLASPAVLRSARFAALTGDQEEGGAPHTLLELRPDGSATPGRIEITAGSKSCILIQPLRATVRTECR